jgi:uncharacterized protein (TIGR02145 family)
MEFRKALIIDQRDGSHYGSIQIGHQILLDSNLKLKMNHEQCWAYDNEINNVAKHGYLYTWDAACKISEGMPGWHLPTKEEWETLIDYLGKETEKVYHQILNGSGKEFQVCFGGFRDTDDEVFFGQGSDAAHWSATACDEDTAWFFDVNSVSKTAELGAEDIRSGYSIRLFRNQ